MNKYGKRVLIVRSYYWYLTFHWQRHPTQIQRSDRARFTTLSVVKRSSTEGCARCAVRESAKAATEIKFILAICRFYLQLRNRSQLSMNHYLGKIRTRIVPNLINYALPMEGIKLTYNTAIANKQTLFEFYLDCHTILGSHARRAHIKRQVFDQSTSITP